MKSYRFRFFRFGRARRSTTVRSTSVLFKRFSSFEGLELRSMLSGGSLLSDSALVSNQDVHETPVEQLSLSNLLSSQMSNAPVADPLADTGSSDAPNATPLVGTEQSGVTVVLQDLNGNTITSLVAGQDFNVKVYVTDLRSPSTLSGVQSAFVGLVYNSNLVSLSAPENVTIASRFNNFVDSTFTSGKIVMGGYDINTDPAQVVPAGTPQLLYTAKLHADVSGQAAFTTTFEDSQDNIWFLGGENSTPLTAEDVSLGSNSLSIVAQPALSINDVTKVEGNTNQDYVFTVSLSAAAAEQVTVVYATSNGTATAGSDYTAKSGTLTFIPGQTQQLVTISVLGDTISELDETFNVVLSNPTSNVTLDDATGVGTIQDDDMPVLSIQSVSQNEGDENNTMVFTVTISQAGAEAVTVQYSTVAGSALAGQDYTATSGTLTFAAGSTAAQMITVTILGDTVQEETESFQLNLTAPTGASFGTGSGEATGTIVNDDGPILNIGPGAISQNEGDSNSTMVFTVTLSQSNDQPVTVVYNTANGTATAGSDYTATSGTLTFAAGTTDTQYITVEILGDTIDEANEAFTVVLSSPGNAVIDQSTSTGTILNDDHTINLEGPTSVAENSGPYVVTAKLSSASTETVTVVWTTADGTATGGSDYTTASGTLTFAPGATQALITVNLIGDTNVEPSETFTINLSAPSGATLGENSDFTATVANDDQLPTIGFKDSTVSQNEGNAGGTPFLFTVKLSAASNEQVTVAYATTDLTANSSDYTATSGTLTFAPGETVKVITVMVTGDTVHENANETFRINLSAPSGATLGSGASQSNATIVDDDPVPPISISDVSKAEGDSGTTAFVFTVSLANSSVLSTTVVYNTQDGTAKANGDYTSTSGTLTFAAGETSKVITVLVKGDLIDEGDETFSVVLSSPTNGTLADATGLGTIQDEAGDNISIVPSTVSGKVFADANGNGVQNGLEKSLAGIQVNLTGDATMQTTTGTDGSYTFGALQPGTYTIKFTMPSQYKTGTALLGSLGGTAVENGFTFTIESPGGVDATNYHYTTPGLKSQYLSLRELMSSNLGNTSNLPSGQVSVAINTVTNPVNASNATNTSVSGTGTAGAIVSVSVSDGTNTTTPYTTTVASNGTWSITGINVVALTDGTLTYTATATGSGASNVDTITTVKDTIAPTLAIGTVTNPINSGNVTDTAISGTGTSGASISVTVSDGNNSTAAKTTTVSGGNWSLGGIDVSTLSNGTVTYTVTATDAAGNTTTKTITSVKNTTGPALDVTTYPTVVGPSNQANVTIAGTATAGSTITLNVTDSAATQVGPLTTTAASDGTWSFTGLDLTSMTSTITFTVVATDSQGNTTSVVKTAEKDSTTEVSIGEVTDPINATNAATVAISGTGEPGATVKIVVNDTNDTTPATAEVSVTVDSTGNWSATVDVTSLADGVLTFTVTATDAVGNTKTVSITANKDTVAPELAVNDVGPIGIGNADSVPLSGTVEPGATVMIVASNGDASLTAVAATVDASGNWTASIDVRSLGDGTISFNVSASDAAGNVTEVTKTAVKTTIAINDIATINAAGAGNVSIGGTGEAGAQVTVVVNNGDNQTDQYQTTIGEDGTWSLTEINVTGLLDGTLTFTATATVGEKSVTVSKTALKDTIVEVEADPLADPINIASLPGVVVGGTVEVGSTIVVVATDPATGTTSPISATVDAEGNWTATLDVSGLADGTITFTITATDAVGNVKTITVATTKDTSAPELDVDDVQDIGLSTMGAVVVSGTTEPNASVTIVASNGDQNVPAITVVADASGNWTASLDVSALDDGTITFDVTATDAAGNETTGSATATKRTLAVASVEDPITQANQDSVTLTGTGQPGATVSVVGKSGSDSTDPATVQIDESGNWTLTIDVSDLDDGDITFDVTATSGDGSITKSIGAVKDTIAEGTIDGDVDPVTSTNQSNVELSGTAELDAVVSVVIKDQSDTPTTAVLADNAAGVWYVSGIDASGLLDGPITYEITVTDANGNVTVYTLVSLKDTSGPTLAINAVESPIGIAQLVSISGTTEANGLISVIVSDGTNSTTEYTATADAEGNWSISGIDVGSLEDGTLTFTVTATDSLGNETTDTATAQKEALAILSLTSPITSSNQAAVVLNGSGQVGATVEVVATDGTGSTTPLTVVIDESGDWSLTVNVTDLADGTITFNVKATSGENFVTSSKTALKDTIATGSIVSATNPVNSGNVTAAEINGTAELGSTVAVIVTDSGTGSTAEMNPSVGEDGTWSLTGIDLSGLLDGDVIYSVRITDTNGNENVYTLTAQKETVASDLAITGVDSPIGIAEHKNVSIHGTGEPGDTVTVVVSLGDQSTSEYTVQVDESSNWVIAGIDTSSLPDGELTFNVSAEDTFGNVTTAQTTSQKITVQIDARAPITQTDQANVTITGTGEVGATVSLTRRHSLGATDLVVGTTTIGEDGIWSISGINLSTLTDGDIIFTATATSDSATAVAILQLKKDANVEFQVLQIIDVTAANELDYVVSGASEPGSTVVLHISDGTTTLGPFSVTTDSSSAANVPWMINGLDLSTLSDGEITFNFTVTDALGNIKTFDLTKSKDTQVTLAVDSPANINLANALTYSLAGSTDPGATVVVTFSNGGQSTDPANAVVDESGVWTLTNPSLSGIDDGDLTVTVVATDSVGNYSTSSYTISKDTSAPTLAEPFTPPMNIVNSPAYSFGGQAEMGASVLVTFADETLTTDPANAVVDGTGAWTLTNYNLSGLADGTIVITIVATDGAGNSTTLTLERLKDTMAPDVAIGDVDDPISAGIATAVTISGTGQAGATLSVSASDGTTTLEPDAVTIDELGNWSMTIDVSTLTDGTITFVATATDDVGNTASDDTTAQKDTIDPLVALADNSPFSENEDWLSYE